jgi:Ni,Fe-hydrogenase III component G
MNTTNNMKREKIPHDEVRLVIERFDFDKVRKAMAFLNWKWTDSANMSIQEVPSVSKLIFTAMRILTEVADDAEYISTGGFHARRLCREDGSEYLDLCFVIEAADSEYPE